MREGAAIETIQARVGSDPQSACRTWRESVIVFSLGLFVSCDLDSGVDPPLGGPGLSILAGHGGRDYLCAGFRADLVLARNAGLSASKQHSVPRFTFRQQATALNLR